MLPIFPQELIDLIIDKLYDDPPTLRAFSLVCRAAVASSQINIFHTVVLKLLRSEKDGLTPCQKLSKLLTSSPHLAPLIKDLQVIDVDGYTPQVNASAQQISSILPLLHLTHISIHCSAHLAWRTLPKILQDSLQKTFGSPGLESIQIWGIYLPCSLEYSAFYVFGSAPSSLQTLAFGVDGSDYSHLPPPSFEWLPKLRSLAISSLEWDCPEHLACALSNPALDFSFLRSLSISDLVASEVRLLLDAIRNPSALQELSVWLNTEDTYVLPLAALSNLRSVRFTFSRNSVSNLLDAIRDCATNPCLEHIVLCLGHHDDAISISDWVDVAVAVIAGGKRVEIHIDGSSGAALQKAQVGMTFIDTQGLLILKDSKWLSLQDICMQD
ncbi:hypothetical protein C8J57DRAFT_1322621 [Mycena rebaudengoi]|nr:hypothetical protein C8J57DRAFT_1322621 [Mycena rebaudengoi]